MEGDGYDEATLPFRSSEPTARRRNSVGEIGIDEKVEDWNQWFLKNCCRVSLRACNGQYLRLAWWKRFMGSLKAFPRVDSMWHEDDGWNIYYVDEEEFNLNNNMNEQDAGEKDREKSIEEDDELTSKPFRIALQSCSNRCF